MSRPWSLSVIIPAFNEEAAIGKVLGAIPARLVRRVIVVDNGSTDGTAARAVQMTPPAHAFPGSETTNATTKKDASNPRKVCQQEDLITGRTYLGPMESAVVAPRRLETGCGFIGTPPGAGTRVHRPPD